MDAGRYRHRQPIWRLVVDGQDITALARPRLISINLTEKRGADADELEIKLTDHDGQLAIPPKQAICSLHIGWRELGSGEGAGPGAEVLIDKGSFKVDETCHAGSPDTLTIRARSADLTRAFRNRRTASWSSTTLGDILSEVAGRNALALRCAEDLAAVAVDHLAQSRESDAALIARLGRQYDAVATIKKQTLLFAPCGSGQTPGGAAIPPVTLTRTSGDGHSWKAADRGAYTGVIAKYTDRAGAQQRQVVAGSDGNAKTLGRIYGSQATAQRAAEAAFKKLQRGKAEFSLTLAVGRPDLHPEKTVTVSGFKPQIDSTDWLIVEARHEIGSKGLATTLQMELGSGESAAT